MARGGLLVGAKSEATVDVGRSMAPRAFGDSSRSDARGFPGKEAGRFSETGWKLRSGHGMRGALASRGEGTQAWGAAQAFAYACVSVWGARTNTNL